MDLNSLIELVPNLTDCIPSEHLESVACDLVGFCATCSTGSCTGSLGVSAGWSMGLLQVFVKVGG